jgi:flagellar protein FliL
MNLFKKTILVIGIITVLGVGGYVVWDQLFTSEKEVKAKDINQSMDTVLDQPVDELIEQSIDTETITTNFVDKGFIKTKFKIITSSKEKAEEIKKLQFLVESTIIKSLNEMKQEEAKGLQGFTYIETILKDKLNKELGKDYITRVYTVDLLIQ